ncbi:universal stress protein [Piscinibacter sp. HJYY11]|uniref:universal stress protein n=1 Tax=Piscinibacter sp. HJYY11 TaxID=2801333 RepID=UPI00191DD99D|nr:universal stress protein [Piscinibacter sp. HJYY11]MBL0726452.1 universal stress protein [Piscinibacter sp. HJYY11]
MSPIKHILLHLDASPRCAVRLQVARQLAITHEARVTGLFAVTSSFAEMPFTAAESSQAGAFVLKLDADRRERALSAFDRFSKEAGPLIDWRELGTEPPTWGVAQAALCADLVVLGQHEPGSATARDVPADFVESVVVDSGKPALVVPYTGDVRTVGHNVLVAWNASRESARALGAALPLLAHAKQVHVVSWNDPQGAVQAAADRAQLEQYLASHGISATLHWYGDGPGQAGERLLSLTTDLGSDLLVMGCYGHSRARELVLGGATRTVLRSMTVPVLLAH